MAANRWQQALTVGCVAVFLTTSCTSLHTVNIPSSDSPPASPAVEIGDTVVITSRDANKKRFKVTAIETDALIGKGERVAYADMATLNVEQVRSVTVAWVMIAIAAAALIVAHAIDEDPPDYAVPNAVPN